MGTKLQEFQNYRCISTIIYKIKLILTAHMLSVSLDIEWTMQSAERLRKEVFLCRGSS